MLELNDSRWSQLKATYSSGTTVARQLLALRSGELSKEDEENFWQELCHQDDSTEAGYAAVPHLVQMAETTGSEQSLFLLGMAANIVCCSTLPRSHKVPDFLSNPLSEASRLGLHQLGELLRAGNLPQGQANTRGFLSAIAGFSKEAEIYLAIESFDCLVKCPRCGNGFFVERLPGKSM